MPKKLYESTTTLYPRLDKDHVDVAKDILTDLLDKNPKYTDKKLHLELTLTESKETGNANLRIVISDPTNLSAKEMLFYGAVILLAILLNIFVL